MYVSFFSRVDCNLRWRWMLQSPCFFCGVVIIKKRKKRRVANWKYTLRFHRPLCVHNERGLFIRLLVPFFLLSPFYLLTATGSSCCVFSLIFRWGELRPKDWNSGLKGWRFGPLYIYSFKDFILSKHWRAECIKDNCIFPQRHYWASLIGISCRPVIPRDAGWLVTLCIRSGVLNYLATRGIRLALLNRKWCNHTGPISSDI